MPLENGSRLGRYEIESPLGAGGMGEVYKARDPRLGRTVAIKVLPAHLSTSEEARERLTREAKAISSLSHPNICGLYDLGHEEGVDFLVIEYLEGETLAERLERGALGADELLKIATGVARGLDAAHGEGLVHRDLKPGNVMLTEGGAKLLDFGLAKNMLAAAGDMTAPPTATSPLTEAGSIVGTFQYMAPEILEGEAADARSDIFAFGCMLFEMATGQKAFGGKTQASLIAGILEREPPSVTSIVPLAPPALDRLIRTCVAKSPRERRQSMHDVLLDLEWIEEGGSRAGVPTPIARGRKSRERLAWGLAALFAVVAVALAALQLASRPEPPRKTVSSLMPYDTDGETLLRRAYGLSLSPDGRRLSFNGRGADGIRRIYVRDLSQPVPALLPGTEGASWATWSPDSRSIAFHHDGYLKRVDVDGGLPVTIAESEELLGASWTGDGEIVFSPGAGRPLHRVSAEGGTPQPFGPGSGSEADDDPDEASESATRRTWFARADPWLLPDGEHVVYAYLTPDRPKNGVRIASLDGTDDRPLLDVFSNAAYSDGHLFYADGGALVARPFDPSSLEFSGPARTIAPDVHQEWLFADFSVVPGLLAFSPTRPQGERQLNWYARDGSPSGTLAAGMELDDVALSDDERFLAVARRENDAFDIWTVDLAREVYTRVTFSELADDPIWSPDGKTLVYADRGQLKSKRASGVGEPVVLYEDGTDKVLQDWSRDGETIFFLHNAEQEDIWVLESADPDSRSLGELVLRTGSGDEAADIRARPVIAGPYREVHAQLSPDGRWLAYASNESGAMQVYVVSWPELDVRWQISKDGGSMPRWRGDGREIFFVSLERELMAVEVNAGETEFIIGAAEKLFDTAMGIDATVRTHGFVSTADGERFLIGEEVEMDADSLPIMNLIQNPLAGIPGG